MPAITSLILDMPAPAPLKRYVVGSTTRLALFAKEMAFAAAAALPAPETPPPAPPVKIVVRALKVTAPPAPRRVLAPLVVGDQRFAGLLHRVARVPGEARQVLLRGQPQHVRCGDGEDHTRGKVPQAGPGLLGRVPALRAEQGAQALDRAPDAVDDEALAEVPDVFVELVPAGRLLDRIAPGQPLGLLQGLGVVPVHVLAVGAVIRRERLAARDHSDDLVVTGALHRLERRPGFPDLVAAVIVLLDQVAVLAPLVVRVDLDEERTRVPLELPQLLDQRVRLVRVGAQRTGDRGEVGLQRRPAVGDRFRRREQLIGLGGLVEGL
ncbi:hypothetical protein NEH83_11775 [Streptomyces sp. JUS-F4]|uniref:hypothetical protein n=1 Tax=Streptomyces sp. JUS-F4 TaxID=2951988 RepID=UPI0026666E8B|nr:hypothetical protein [Streptomyces sp. JUS-F4]WKN14833.1 hypothetical protein NEH83_11775 [Streptomyces sp. JUS-F4]